MPPEGTFRWLHLSLADQTARSWIEGCDTLPGAVRELLLSADTHASAVVEADAVACVLQDFERDFDREQSERLGALRIALTPSMVVTTRLHPLQSVDMVRQRIGAGLAVSGPAGALDLVVSTIAQTITGVSRALSAEVQSAEDAFLAGYAQGDSRRLLGLRRRLALCHRLLDGMRSVFRRLEEDEDLSGELLPVVEKLSQRLQALEGDIRGIQHQLRQLREEIDIQETQRTNQNLYILSLVTALMLPATLVTGLFGMNTGGLPFAGHDYGTFGATILAGAAAGATYLALRAMGFMRR